MTVSDDGTASFTFVVESSPRCPRTVSWFLYVLVMAAALTGGALLLEPAGSAAGTPPFRTDTFMSLNTRGMRENTSTDPMRTVYEFDVHSNLTGEKIGTATDSVFCSTTTPPPCQVFDAVTTFHLPDGEITDHAQVSVVPDPNGPAASSSAPARAGTVSSPAPAPMRGRRPRSA